MGSIETRAHLPLMSKRACGDREGATGHAVGRFSVATYRTPLTKFNPEPHFCQLARGKFFNVTSIASMLVQLDRESVQVGHNRIRVLVGKLDLRHFLVL